MTKFGYNVLRVDNASRERLWRHCANLPAGCILFYNHQGDLAYEFKRDFPDWIVIHRVWPDHEDHLRDTPSGWYRKHANRGRDGVIVHTVNETAFSNQLLAWSTELTKIARADGTRFVHLNCAVGIPEPHDWTSPDARRFLEEIAKDGDRHYVGLHEYWPSNPTGLMRGTSLQNPVIQDPDQWPKSLEDAFPGWLCGRYHFLHLACDEMGIPRPKILLTEVGTAEIGAVDGWQKALPKTQGYMNLDGWKANREVWRQWWGDEWTHEEAYAEQMLYALKVLWAGIDAAIVFGWGDSGGWDAFDVADATLFQSCMEVGLRTQHPTPPPPPIPVPTPTPQPVEVPFPPFSEFYPAFIKIPAPANLRKQPFIGNNLIKRLEAGTYDYYIAPSEFVSDGMLKWYPVNLGAMNVEGWLREDVFTYDLRDKMHHFAFTDHEIIALQTARDILNRLG